MTVLSHQETLQVQVTPDQAFEVIDDVERMPQWLHRCTELEVLDDPPLRIGSRLRYSYREGRRTGRMDGEVVAREAGESLEMLYTDSMMQVTVVLAVSGPPAGPAALTHRVDIAPRGIGKVFSPLIRRQLPGQVRGAMAELEQLLESDARSH